MDNASKALIMAGGVLLAVMVVSLTMYLIASARGFASASNEQAELSAIESFNRYYLSFDSSITALDALNICNKAKDDSTRTNHTHEVAISGVDYNALQNLLTDVDGVSYMSEPYTYSYEFDSDGYINKVIVNKVN